MLLPHNAIVAVADGANLNIYRNAGVEGHLQLEPAATPDLHPHGHASGGRHHSGAANPDRQQLGEDAFAAAVVSWMQSEVQSGSITNLFVIASPKSLGEMRQHYTTALRAAIVGEEAKELVGHPISEIEAAIHSVR